MKNYIILVFLFLSLSAFCQNDRIIRQIDFFSEFPSYRTRLDIVTLPQSSKEIVAARLSLSSTNLVIQEYLRVGKDTFLYVSYDTSSYKIVEKGYVVPSEKIIQEDTILFLNPVTFQIGNLITLTSKPNRQGLWEIYKDNFEIRGRYLNNKKTGIWHLENMRKEDYREQIYKDDSLIYEKQLNLAISKDIDSTQKWLIGKWDIVDNVIYNATDFNGYEKNKRQTTGFRSHAQNNIYRYENGDVLEFCPNSVIKMYSKTFDYKTRKYSFTEPQLGTWKINSDFLIEIQTADSQKITYKPLYMKDDNFRLEKRTID